MTRTYNMLKFDEWLEKRDPELSEGIKKNLGILGALSVPMATSVAGGAAGLATGGPLGAIAGFLGGKHLGRKAAEKIFPQGATDAMKK